ncbi:MAG: ABC transporter permease [Eubacterium sp.]|nr:ABC transporter permease [Eubacterium sp.]
MTGKLALRNMKRSMSDYAVYFVTLIIGISVFYVFNAISDQKVVLSIYKSDYSVIDLLRNIISVASVIVSVVLAFLVVYASNFLIRRRKKEFGVYMLLGMGKKKIAGILMMETVIIGIISLVVGLGIGIILSQGMSILVAKLFEADMSKFSFEVSTGAVGKTILYFLVVYAFVLLLDLFMIGKSRLIQLLNAERRSEKRTAKNPYVCLVVFILAAAVLGHAYYRVTAAAENIDTQAALLIEIAKGIVSTFLIFWSLSGFLIFVAKLRKKSYFKGINVFTTKEISSRINTNVLAGSIICLLLFLTICIFSSSFSINNSLNENVKTLMPADVQFYNYIKVNDDVRGVKDKTPISEYLKHKKVDPHMFSESAEVLLYMYQEEDMSVYNEVGGGNVFTTGAILAQSDYNKVAEINGLEPVSLEKDEYTIVANYDYIVPEWNKRMLAGQKIHLAGKEYHPASSECVNGFLQMSANPTNSGFTVVPDEAVSDENLMPYSWFYIANYNKNYAKGVEYVEQFLNNETFKKSLGSHTYVETREYMLSKSISLASLIVFLGLYLGIIFLLASSALLSLKELTQAADNRDKYEILRKIGIDEKMIHRSLFRQNAIFFGMPLGLAVIHSIFGIQVCTYVLEVFGKSGLTQAIVMTAAGLLVIYMIYFIITYRCSRRIIRD